MRGLALVVSALALLHFAHGTAEAAVIFFANSPTSNSTNWTNAVTGLNGVINTNVNFNSHPLGALNSTFYLASDGVTLTAVGDASTISSGAGPAQGNTSSSPLSSGEGPNSASNYLFDGSAPSSLTVTFADPVLAAGLFIIDYFNPANDNPLTLEAFTGPNGTGVSLGMISSAAFNFQDNNQYFMGLLSTGHDIRSIRFTDVNAVTGDTTGIDNIRFAQVSQVDAAAAPEPASLAVFGMMMAGGAFYGWRRRQQAVVA